MKVDIEYIQECRTKERERERDTKNTETCDLPALMHVIDVDNGRTLGVGSSIGCGPPFFYCGFLLDSSIKVETCFDNHCEEDPGRPVVKGKGKGKGKGKVVLLRAQITKVLFC